MYGAQQLMPPLPTKQPIPSTYEPTPTNDTTTTEGQYTSRSNAFAITYPPGWKALEPETSTTENTFVYVSDNSNELVLSYEPLRPYIGMENQTTQEILENVRDYKLSLGAGLGKYSPNIIDETSTVIDGKEGTKYTIKIDPLAENSSLKYDTVEWYFFAIDNRMLIIQLSGPNLETMNQILSTISFLDEEIPDMCGGIAGIDCPEGYRCKLDGTYPDAGGTCITDSPKPPSTTPTLQ
jgi:hypothetical protein